ncbi:MAG: glycosyltransferase family 2 protein [Deltaproteobacteria bacterium]|nr:glycosyltransferase family 2 protein [Deltaproteobacteria bacterium]
MKDKICFSVVIPVYNKDPYILRAISSVLTQDYENYELIVVNDGSTDGTAQIISQINSPKLRVITQDNCGVSAARNRGIQEAASDYIAFLDGDDEWLHGFLSEMAVLVSKYPEAGIYGTNVIFRFADGSMNSNSYDALFPSGVNDGILDDYFRVFYTNALSPFCNSGCCIPKRIFQELGAYKENVILTEDTDMWCRIALKYPVVFSLSPLLIYHLEIPSNTTTLMQFEDFEVSKMLQAALEGDIVPDKFRASVTKFIAFQQLSLIRRAILLGHRKFSLKKLLDWRILNNYPLQFVFLLCCILSPDRLTSFLYGFFKRRDRKFGCKL